MKARLFALFLAFAGCADLTSAFVVVQETNVPNPPPPCIGYRYHYERSVERACDPSPRLVHICADEPLCNAQIDAILEPFANCEENGGYEVPIPDVCD
jgi:hypothetical protein